MDKQYCEVLNEQRVKNKEKSKYLRKSFSSLYSPHLLKDFKNVDNHIVQMFMEVVNDMQIFMTANCKLSEKYDHKVYFPSAKS